MPSIVLVKTQEDYFKHLEVVRLYKQLFHLGLKEAVEQIDFMVYKEGYEIPVAEADLITAAHFVYAVSKLGLIYQLRSGLSLPLKRAGRNS